MICRLVPRLLGTAVAAASVSVVFAMLAAERAQAASTNRPA
jgi:hypothetical protein